MAFGILAQRFAVSSSHFCSSSFLFCQVSGLIHIHWRLNGVIVDKAFLVHGVAVAGVNVFFLLRVIVLYVPKAIAFAGLSLWGYTTKKDLSGWGKFLFMASVGLLIAIVVNFFIGSTMGSLIISSLVVIVFSAVTAYETQMIRNLYVEGGGEMNERSSIFGAFALYGSFVTLFIHVLNILGIMRD